MQRSDPSFLTKVKRNNLRSGVLAGLGLVAFIDEAVFHQLLHWHHFYDNSTTAIGLVSDGLFHAFNWFATIASMFMMASLRVNQSFRLPEKGNIEYGLLFIRNVHTKQCRVSDCSYPVEP